LKPEPDGTTAAGRGDPPRQSDDAAFARLHLLTVILTGRCNLRCRYCYQAPGRSTSLPWPTLRTALDLVARSREPVVRVLFTGGEPLLAFAQLRRAVEYLQTRGDERRRVLFGLNTNGTLLTTEIADFLARHRFLVQLSFDGVARAQDHRGRGTFAGLDRLLDDLWRRAPDVWRTNLAIGITTTPATIGHLPDSVRYFLDKGVRAVAINPTLMDDPAWQPARIVEIEVAFAHLIDDSLAHLATTGEVPLLVLSSDPGGRSRDAHEPAMCGMTSEGALTVDVDGRGCGCSAFASGILVAAAPALQERASSLTMGRIEAPDFPERYRQFGAAVRQTELFHHKERKRSAYGCCADCAYLPECSLCPASILQIPGNADPHRVSDFCCAFQQAAARARAVFAARRREIRAGAAPR